jgi:hypothetical protein
MCRKWSTLHWWIRLQLGRADLRPVACSFKASTPAPPRTPREVDRESFKAVGWLAPPDRNLLSSGLRGRESADAIDGRSIDSRPGMGALKATCRGSSRGSHGLTTENPSVINQARRRNTPPKCVLKFLSPPTTSIAFWESAMGGSRAAGSPAASKRAPLPTYGAPREADRKSLKASLVEGRRHRNLFSTSLRRSSAPFGSWTPLFLNMASLDQAS